MNDIHRRLAIGSAQFGGTYGIANAYGPPKDAAINDLLERARNAGIDTIDTAASYGASEKRLGNCDILGFKVITKLPVERGAESVANWVRRSVSASLENLRRESLDGLLLHRPGQLFEEGGKEIQSALLRLKSEGRIVKLGVSIYDPSELEKLSAFEWIELVQAPFNIFDDRLETSGWLARLNARGIEVHARSLFLQGLLLMPPSARPVKFSRWKPVWQAWDDWLNTAGITAAQACIAFALQREAIARFVIGFDSPSQLEELMSLRIGDLPPKPQQLASLDPALINPACWNSLS